MKTRTRAWLAIAMLPAAFSDHAIAQTASSATLLAVSDVYIQQSHGRVAPGIKMQGKPTPELTGAGTPATTGPTAPVTCNAQNASSQACYTATQQARPGTR
jgi:hypothetical protein